jgi:hypothetical protein
MTAQFDYAAARHHLMGDQGVIDNRRQCLAGAALPALLPPLGRDPFQLGVGEQAFPVLVLGKIVLPLGADTWKTKIVRASHDFTP